MFKISFGHKFYTIYALLILLRCSHAFFITLTTFEPRFK